MTLKKWQKTALLVLATLGIVYGMIYADVVMRAREATLEGDKFWRWSEHPEEKKQALDARFEKEKADLDGQLAKGKITQEEYDRRLEIAKFDHDQALEESSIKYAYVWYQTTVELFSPPESKWVKIAREKMPQAKEKWRQELRAKGIPFEEYMLD